KPVLSVTNALFCHFKFLLNPSGWITAISMIKVNLPLAVFMMVVAGFFTVNAVLAVILLKMVHAKYRRTGASFQKAQQEFSQGVVTNRTFQTATATAASSAARGAFQSSSASVTEGTFCRDTVEVGCELEEKERFWSELDEVMESIPTGERVVIGADFNGHVGEGNTGDEEVMGKFGVKERNLEGQMVVDFAKRMDMVVVNTYFQGEA
ncbi:hypothetical protein QTP86_010696, partial [Hemibagrus guttatus]